MNFLIVFLGGGIGTMLRHGVNMVALRTVGTGFPFGTLAINVVGSLAIGILTEYFALRGGVPMSARLFFMTGVIGGFTTFSTFSLEAGLLYERGQLGLALLYVAGSVVLGLSAMFGGMALVRGLAP
jgi:CrcB protein